MNAQETIASATVNVFGTAAATFIAIAILAVVAAGVDPLAPLLDVRLPVRQLLVGRSLHALTLSGRTLLVMVRSYVRLTLHGPFARMHRQFRWICIHAPNAPENEDSHPELR